MALPETELARIKKWCDSIWPKHMWDQAKVEADVAPTHVTIVEVRPDWRGGPESTRFPISAAVHEDLRPLGHLLA